MNRPPRRPAARHTQAVQWSTRRLLLNEASPWWRKMWTLQLMGVLCGGWPAQVAACGQPADACSFPPPAEQGRGSDFAGGTRATTERARCYVRTVRAAEESGSDADVWRTIADGIRVGNDDAIVYKHSPHFGPAYLTTATLVRRSALVHVSSTLAKFKSSGGGCGGDSGLSATDVCFHADVLLSVLSGTIDYRVVLSNSPTKPKRFTESWLASHPPLPSLRKFDPSSELGQQEGAFRSSHNRDLMVVLASAEVCFFAPDPAARIIARTTKRELPQGAASRRSPYDFMANLPWGQVTFEWDGKEEAW